MINVEMEGKGKHRIEAARRALGSGLAVKYTRYSNVWKKVFVFPIEGCVYTQVILSSPHCLMYVLCNVYPALYELHGNGYVEKCVRCKREYVRDYRVRKKGKHHHHFTGQYSLFVS